MDTAIENWLSEALISSGIPATLTLPIRVSVLNTAQLVFFPSPTDTGPVQEARQVGKHDNWNDGKVKLYEKLSLLLWVENDTIDICDAGIGVLEFQLSDMVLLGMIVGHR